MGGSRLPDRYKYRSVPSYPCTLYPPVSPISLLTKPAQPTKQTTRPLPFGHHPFLHSPLLPHCPLLGAGAKAKQRQTDTDTYTDRQRHETNPQTDRQTETAERPTPNRHTARITYLYPHTYIFAHPVTDILSLRYDEALLGTWYSVLVARPLRTTSANTYRYIPPAASPHVPPSGPLHVHKSPTARPLKRLAKTTTKAPSEHTSGPILSNHSLNPSVLPHPLLLRSFNQSSSSSSSSSLSIRLDAIQSLLLFEISSRHIHAHAPRFSCGHRSFALPQLTPNALLTRVFFFKITFFRPPWVQHTSRIALGSTTADRARPN